jgi:6-phosphogluconolactonase (cycloisomerase 2 family)
MSRFALILVVLVACGDDDGNVDGGMDAGRDAAADVGELDTAADTGEDATDASADTFDAGPMPTARLMYVAVQGDQRLAVVELGVDGSMTAMTDRDVDLGAGPGTLAYARSTRRLYVGAGNGIVTLSLDESGTPSIEGRTADTGNPVYLAVTDDETRLVSAYFGANELKLHDVSGAPPHAQLDVTSTDEEPHAALIGPNDLIYVPHRNGDVTQWYAIEDDALVDRLAEDGIVLEVCPGSNVALGVYPDWRAHPIHRLRERGVPVTVSTDDPPFFHTTMKNEYARLADAFEWDDGVFSSIAKTSLEAAFCDDQTKERLTKRLEAE